MKKSLFLFSLFFAFLFSISCGSDDSESGKSNAELIEGTWKVLIPFDYYLIFDGNTIAECEQTTLLAECQSNTTWSFSNDSQTVIRLEEIFFHSNDDCAPGQSCPQEINFLKINSISNSTLIIESYVEEDGVKRETDIQNFTLYREG